MSKLPQQSTFDATSSVIDRLYGDDQPQSGRAPADARAVIFAAITQARALDRVAKALERNTRAVMLAGGKTDRASVAKLNDEEAWVVS